MGSGETSPTMVKCHRQLIARLGERPPAVLIDTPFAFQVNARDVADRAVRYFAESVGARMEVASPGLGGGDSVARELELEKVRGASYVFAGPGSPTYALGKWQGTPFADLLVAKLREGGTGGAVTFASAAALTLGPLAVPVYEIYKVGEDPRWEEALGLLVELADLQAVVIPHYDNAEGGTYDTRFCYLGERRLAQMEAELATDVFVLGVDEHTACIIDLDAREATVWGRGGVTVRAAGTSRRFESGTAVSLEKLVTVAAELSGGVRDAPAGPGTGMPPARPGPAVPGPRQTPLEEAIAAAEADFDGAAAAGDAAVAVRAALDLQDVLEAWSADTLQSDQQDRGKATLRSMILRLGERPASGDAVADRLRDQLVELAIEVRDEARGARRWHEADRVRQRLAELGIEIRDTSSGTLWELQGETGET